jgi:hypothetical protein
MKRKKSELLYKDVQCVLRHGRNGKENIPAPSRNETPMVQPVSAHCTDNTILTHFYKHVGNKITHFKEICVKTV